jgi:hypothetical protein
VIRCDGFILVPRAVRDTAKEGGTVSVALTAVEGGEKAAVVPMVTVTARAHPRTNAALPHALIKTNGSHVRSLPLLNSTTVTAGKLVPFGAVVVDEESGTAIDVVTAERSVGERDTFVRTPARPAVLSAIPTR